MSFVKWYILLDWYIIQDMVFGYHKLHHHPRAQMTEKSHQ